MESSKAMERLRTACISNNTSSLLALASEPFLTLGLVLSTIHTVLKAKIGEVTLRLTAD